MRRCHLLRAALVVLVLVAACGDDDGSGGGSGSPLSPPTGGTVTNPVKASRDGTIYRQSVTTPIGDSIVFQVFEPTRLEVGHAYPLVLHGHGYGGQRNKTPDAFQKRLQDAGFYVISIDERGHGDSSGTIRVMDPDFEGQDLIAVLDWAEDLEGLQRRADQTMTVGSYGGSYGGMYQILLYAADPKHRLRVLAPDITPHDLVYSLNPNGTIKSGWATVFALGGEGLGFLTDLISGDPLTLPTPHLGLRQDPVIYESLLNGVLTNRFTQSAINFFEYHSVSYFCDGVAAGPQSFTLGTPDPRLVPPTLPPPADVLLTQGFRDTLFDVNDGVGNYECLKGLGGDVRLLTHQSGHILPLSLGTVGLADPLDPFYQALTFPGFQDQGGTRSCGSLNLDDVQFAWFQEKLLGLGGKVDAVLTTGHDVCVSLAEGDAIEVRDLKRGGEKIAIDSSTPQLNSALGVVGALLGNGAREALLANQTLATVGNGGAILAGIPRLEVQIDPLTGASTGDPIFFLAIGHRPPGQERWDIIDDQITPVRGFGNHVVLMTAIAARLAPGEQVALLIYGFHAQFPVTWSRDLTVPAAKIGGTIELPFLSSGEIVRQGV